MASKILPEAVKQALRRNFTTRRPRAKKQNPKNLPPDAFRYFQQQGRIGGKKNTRNTQNAKRAGEERIRKLCRKMGVNYDALPDKPVKQPNA